MDDKSLILPVKGEADKIKSLKDFYVSFSNPGSRPCYLFGYNRYAGSILKKFKIEGIIDDFTSCSSIAEKPIIRSSEIPANALVLVLAGGKPLTVSRFLDRLNIEHQHYFSLFKLWKKDLCPIHFNEGFESDFLSNREKYEWTYQLLADRESRHCYQNLVNFRLQYDFDFLEGFSDQESQQYFEPFLNLRREGECFADIGAFDGYTSEMFISLCPAYKQIHVFEPDPNNLLNARKRLSHHNHVYFYPIGLSDRAETLRLSSSGSGSRVSDTGDITIKVDALDDVTNTDFSFIKMDIEGGEISALKGAEKTIKRCHPKLAIAIYHCIENSGPFWEVPKKVLSIRSDYDVYVRHYTESIYETVMFFVPRASRAGI
ncbi:MAG: FkbM family methyltransferase [Pseudomonadota bacterium]|nr:FkbM family methyltransferase [Pseudomonadota bacterium]